MAVTNWQDPGATEVLSTHLTGAYDAIGKIEDMIGIETYRESNIPLTHVVSNTDYRVYQAPATKRNWVISATPIAIKKNGSEISTGFSVDYGGGAIVLETGALETDTFTADVDYTITNNKIVNKVAEWINVKDYGLVGNDI